MFDLRMTHVCLFCAETLTTRLDGSPIGFFCGDQCRAASDVREALALKPTHKICQNCSAIWLPDSGCPTCNCTSWLEVTITGETAKFNT